MNIAITLPANLCMEILEGKKLVEIRKSFPKKFNCLTDKVYVIMKNSHRVIMTMKLERFIKYVSVTDLWHNYCYQVRVQFKWLEKYAGNADCLYAWEIGLVSPCQTYVDARELLGVYHNPQSFIYVSQG